MVIADLGAGEGTISQLMAQRAKKVIAIDNSEKMVEFGAELARKHGIANLEYRLGDLEDVPIRSGTVDLAFFSQALHHAVHPERAIGEAWRILKPGGRIAILDLSRHHFEEAREMYADLWLGFTELEIERYLKARASRTWRPPSSIANRKPPTSKRCWRLGRSRYAPRRPQSRRVRVRWKCRWWKSSQSESKSNVKRTVGSWLRFRTFPA